MGGGGGAIGTAVCVLDRGDGGADGRFGEIEAVADEKGKKRNALRRAFNPA